MKIYAIYPFHLLLHLTGWNNPDIINRNGFQNLTDQRVNYLTISPLLIYRKRRQSATHDNSFLEHTAKDKLAMGVE